MLRTLGDMIELTDVEIQLLLREIEVEHLAVVLRYGGSPEIREKFFKNMSERAANLTLQKMNTTECSDSEKRNLLFREFVLKANNICKT